MAFFRGLVGSSSDREADPAISAYYDKKCCASDANLTALGVELRGKLAEAVEAFNLGQAAAPLRAAQGQVGLRGAHTVPQRAACDQGEAMGGCARPARREGSEAHGQLTDAMIVTVQGIAGMQGRADAPTRQGHGARANKGG